MALILTILIAFPLGYRVRLRATAVLSYLAVHSIVFSFQTAGLLLNWIGGDRSAFGDTFPDHDPASYYGYGIVNAAILLAGLGLVLLGHRTAEKRRIRQRTN